VHHLPAIDIDGPIYYLSGPYGGKKRYHIGHILGLLATGEEYYSPHLIVRESSYDRRWAGAR
jgi:hypothetical protein